MKVKDFIDALSKIDPEADIRFKVGPTSTYRKFLASLLNEDGDYEGCMTNLEASLVTSIQYVSFQSSRVVITLEQSYLKEEYFEEELLKFSRKLKEEREANNGEGCK